MPDSQSSQVPAGAILEGKFRVTQEIGRGGMAAVYEAENIDIGKRVAVKLLSADLITSRIVRERFIREARAAAAIHSPYICEVYDSGMYHDRPFLVMELLHGESLYDRMTRMRQLKTSTTLKIIRHVVRGLAKAHEANVVHRDLKPENIFLTRDAEGHLLAKIVDFGLAKFYEGRDGEEKNVRLTREGALFGTPAYMSPEQARGQGEVDHRADLWALGCIVYECLTGRTVWDVQQGVAMILAQIARGALPDPRSARPDLPDSFVEWFYRALHPDVTQRYASARAFMESLEQALPPSDAEPLSSDRGRVLPSLNEIPEPSAQLLAGELRAQPSAKGASATSSTRAIVWLLVAAGIAFAGYGFWLYRQPGRAAGARATQDAHPLRPSDAKVRAPVESGPGAARSGNGQELLRADPLEEALTVGEAARGENPNVAGSLINHAKVAVEAGEEGPCQLAGLGRPRPFDVSAPASHARISAGKEGLLAAWTDSHQDPTRRSVYTTLLDDSLRRVGPVQNVTPEADMAIEPTFVPVPGGYVVLYWDSGSREPGVYLRAILADGRIVTPAKLLSAAKKEQYFPSVAPLPDGRLVAVWSEKRGEAGNSQVVARLLSPDLEPESQAVELTALMSGEASQPEAEAYGEHLFITYRYESSPAKSEIRLLRLKLTDPILKSGLDAPTASDRWGGESITLRAQPKQAEPSVACDRDGCFVVWDNEGSGAFAAFVPHGQSEALWHREFATKGKRPVVVGRPGAKAAIAYFAGDRLLIAQVTRDGVGVSSVISRVSGFQPTPKLVSGSAPGEWLISWRDFEAGHLEAFVARAQCPDSAAP